MDVEGNSPVFHICLLRALLAIDCSSYPLAASVELYLQYL